MTVYVRRHSFMRWGEEQAWVPQRLAWNSTAGVITPTCYRHYGAMISPVCMSRNQTAALYRLENMLHKLGRRK